MRRSGLSLVVSMLLFAVACGEVAPPATPEVAAPPPPPAPETPAAPPPPPAAPPAPADCCRKMENGAARYASLAADGGCASVWDVFNQGGDQEDLKGWEKVNAPECAPVCCELGFTEPKGLEQMPVAACDPSNPDLKVVDAALCK